MAKFRSSGPMGLATMREASSSADEALAPDRLIGEILSDRLNFSAEQVDEILSHSRENRIRFGAAAVALGLASQDDVLQALAEQFGYPYASEERRKLSPELVALNQPFSLQA